MALSKGAKVGAVKATMQELMGAMGSMSPDRARNGKKKKQKPMPAMAKAKMGKDHDHDGM